MSSQVGNVKSGVDGSTVRSIVKSETGRRRLKIWIIETVEKFKCFDFFCGWNICGTLVG